MTHLSLVVLATLALTSCHSDRPKRVVGNQALTKQTQAQQDLTLTEGASARSSSDCDKEEEVAPVELFTYFRCNTSNWELTDENLMSSKDQVYSLEITVTEEWMTEVGDSCVFTVTDKKGEWTPNTVEFVSTDLPVVDGLVYAAVNTEEAGAKTFRMKFSKPGRYHVGFSYENRLFTLLPL